MAKKAEEIKVVVTLKEDGNLLVEGNLVPLASLHLLNEASSILIKDIANGEKDQPSESKEEIYTKEQ